MFPQIYLTIENTSLKSGFSNLTDINSQQTFIQPCYHKGYNGLRKWIDGRDQIYRN